MARILRPPLGRQEDTNSNLSQPATFAHPILLLCLTFSTGEHARYIPSVERYILNDDELASSKYGFQCLVALGLCLLSGSQPRRMWTVYRRANTLLQLHIDDIETRRFWTHCSGNYSRQIGGQVCSPLR